MKFLTVAFIIAVVIALFWLIGNIDDQIEDWYLGKLFGDITTYSSDVQEIASDAAYWYRKLPIYFLYFGILEGILTLESKGGKKISFDVTLVFLCCAIIFAILTFGIYAPLNPGIMYSSLFIMGIILIVAKLIPLMFERQMGELSGFISYPLAGIASSIPFFGHMFG